MSNTTLTLTYNKSRTPQEDNGGVNFLEIKQ